MNVYRLVPLALLALAACNRSPEIKEEMSAEEVAAEVSGVKFQPGQWQREVEIVSATAPGLPEATLKQMVGQKSSSEDCMTPEQASRPDADFLAAQQNSECTYGDWTMENGRMSGTISCSGGQMPGTVNITMNGQYGAEAYQVDMNMETSGISGMALNIQARTVGKRIGECMGGAL